MKKGIIAAAAAVIVAGAGGGSVALLASSASATGVIGAWTHFTLHLPGQMQRGTITASGELLSGSGTFIPTQNKGSGEPVLKADINGCYFRIWITGARNDHGTYLITASTEPHNACAGMQGSGDWSLNLAGTGVKAQGPLVLYRPSPAKTVITTAPPSTSPPPSTPPPS